MNKELPKVYEPQQVESRIYQMWEDHDCFKGVEDSKKKPFSIVMPPPNVTGQLHMGHALDCTLQDILTRFKRMQGYAALWVPGTDHAGIATQIKVEEELRVKEGKTRYDLGREKFLERVWKWKEEYGNRIVQQQKKMGVSCDWSRARFTMDEGCSKAVRETFCELYDKGLIYKGSRIINWCPHCVTALSDAEVEYVDKPGHLWYIRYPLADGSGDIVVATTRPETMMGDTGVAVNPNDEKFKHLIGKKCILPIMNREIPIVGDEYCEIGFGTGAVKMTPAHDPNDFEVGLRHNLEVIRVIADNGHINENGGPYNGMDRYECRKAIVKDLEEQGYLVKVEPYNHNVGTCYRCHNDVEPLISAQWFVKMEPLAKEALRVVNEGEVKFVPERFSKTYTNWMENCHDWCISRQLWWGHQIPAWTCEDCGHINVKREDPTACEKCGSTHLTREEDVLDTWFSSALWPFSTLGWPEQTADLNYWYPTSVMVTGYDIIFFWVARMIFSGCEQMKKIPFHTVLIHGLVRDDKGRKMSKSLGNGIDPLEMAEKYGADALRFNLITGNSPGNDTRFYTEKCEAMRNFANKIWNASRFVMMNLTIDRYELPAADKLEREDKWVLSKLNRLVKEVTENLDSFEIGVASAKVYDFIWDTYCDWYIELTKTRLNGTDEDAKLTAQNVLCYVLVTLLKLLHPFMPFITEEIYQALPKCDGAEDILMTAQWPEYTEALSFPAEESAMEAVMDLIRAIRARRAEMNVPPSKKAELMIVTDQAEPYQQGLHFIQRLAYASNVTFPETAPADVTGLVSVVTHDATAYLPLSELVDLAAERERIAKELEKAKNGLRITEGKLANEKFVAHAPENVVNAEREKVAKYQELIAKLEESAKAMA
ncbi:valine--tRNA ligase [Dysosmobacter sp.]|jgi:valyl-tRNA synthetase|uniref:valine--tRNA ligase n=1 Tax=Dysosmobacter sp. TaxID=2591382 RepID=UPI002672258A|nr:valine--tRNA ligase [Dysosmobacter sp.]MCI6016396.1 valine--tRNA ligase [Dysosmobacter sp.]MCI7215972.1 valine--tRNA ligase [Dysosmobacter sp.]MDY3654442.1 valine--tRNA ligase [Dysosmobacter sp.]